MIIIVMMKAMIIIAIIMRPILQARLYCLKSSTCYTKTKTSCWNGSTLGWSLSTNHWVDWSLWGELYTKVNPQFMEPIGR